MRQRKPFPFHWFPAALMAALLLSASGANAQKPPQGTSQDISQDLDRLYAELSAARDPFSAGRTEARIRNLLAQTGSPGADLLLEQGRAAEEAGEGLLALRKYDGAHLAAPGSLEPLYARARTLIALDRPREAVVALEALLTQEERHIPALLLLAALRQSLGQEARAFELLKEALDLSPQSAEAARALKALGPPPAD